MSETLTTTTKRHRDPAADSPPETPKRLRNSYINNEQQETTQYLLDFFTSESDPFLHFAPQPEPDPDNNLSDNEKERVIRHLFEASDDELGIPSRVDDVIVCGDDVTGDGDGYFGDFGLWEFEDEAANYYTLLQSELFMQ